MKIRKATKKDLKEMFEIIKLNSPNYQKNLAENEIKEMFSKALIKPIYFVVEDNGKIVAFNGFIHSWVDNMVVDLFWVNTHPDYKGKGIQGKLINHVIKNIKKIKKPKVRMIIISTKIPSFFKKFGFKIITDKYDRDYVLMGMKLR